MACNITLLFSIFLLLSSLDGMTTCSMAERVANVFRFENQSNTCSIKQTKPILRLVWNNSSANISEIIRPKESQTHKLYEIQFSNCDKNTRSRAVAETITYPAGYEAYYDGMLFDYRVKIAIKTRNDQNGQNGQAVISIASRYKVALNVSVAHNQIWLNVSINDEYYTMSAAKTDDKWDFGYTSHGSSRDIIKGFYTTSRNVQRQDDDKIEQQNPIVNSIVHLNFPDLGITWNVDVVQEKLSNGGRVSVDMERRGSFSNSLTFDGSWNSNDTTLGLILRARESHFEPFLQLNLNSSNINEMSLFEMELASPLYNWQWMTSTTKSGRPGDRRIDITSRANYILRPITNPITYLLSYRESNQSRLLDLRHNVSSELYRMESNLTVDRDSTGAIMTEIQQKANSPLGKLFNLDLKQIFHQLGSSFWETVVMTSGLVDMHVSARWEHSILEFYRKRFTFHSHSEDLLPSTIITVEYSDCRRFRHEVLLPFLARKYVLLIEFQDLHSYQPVHFSLSDQNQFLSNETGNTLEIDLFKTEVPNIVIVSQENLNQFLVQLANQSKKVTEHLLSISKDVEHPVNRLLKPLFRTTSVSLMFINLSYIINQYSEFGLMRELIKMMNY